MTDILFYKLVQQLKTKFIIYKTNKKIQRHLYMNVDEKGKLTHVANSAASFNALVGGHRRIKKLLVSVNLE